MATYTIGEARRDLTRLIAEAEHGEQVEITDGNRLVARLQAVNGETNEELLARIHAEALAGPRLGADSVEIVRRLRDGRAEELSRISATRNGL